MVPVHCIGQQRISRTTRIALLGAAALAAIVPGAALAQDPAAPAVETAGGGASAASSSARVFGPSYFAQFAPRNALDMVERLPGFSIVGGDDNGQRGLGQASQNVIVNGVRFSSKSDSVRDQLRRISASDVVRIELVDGSTLDIPGVSGLVANVIYESSKPKGQFRWVGGFRAHNTRAAYYGGSASITGTSGSLGYTVSISNANDRGGADGTTLISGPTGALIERQETMFSATFENPKLATNLTYQFSPQVVGHLNLSAQKDFYDRRDPEIGFRVSGPIRTRDSRTAERTPRYEIGGDFEFPLGPGKLKLIGLDRHEHDNYAAVLVDSYSDATPSEGYKFDQKNLTAERIARLEYSWKLFGVDFQASGESAYNRLDRTSSLATLDASGAFVDVPFAAGIGGVTEQRYETSLSMSGQISPKLSLQAIGAVEFSTIRQTGSAANSRQFTRPKGSLTGTWKPSAGFDVTLTVARRVSQLSFGDFLASVELNQDNANGGNNELVPYQSWNLELGINKSLGPWGSIKFEARQAWFEDFIDWFPIPGGGEARGNIGNAHRLHLEANATVNFDPLGFKGARLDIQAVKRWMHVRDPFTGQDRVFSYDQIGLVNATFRHDIPHTQWAWGATLNHNDSAPYARRYEVGRQWEGPVFAGLFIENKDVFGLTVQARADNLLDARNRLYRTVYAGSRPKGAVLFTEDTNRRIGPIFQVSVSGNF